MKKHLSILCSTLLLSLSASAQIYFNYDFENGIPSTFTLIDNDKNEPNADAKEIGFAVGIPWIASIPPQDENFAASATSWYENKGTSDDWMILPAFTVEDNGVSLTWRARSRNKRVLEGYSVYVSETGGNTIADFDMENPLFTTTGQKYAWSYHNINLDAYKGKTISIAFVDNTTDKGMIYIDDIMAGVYSPLQIVCDMGDRTHYGGNVKFYGTVTNVGPDVINGYTITLKSGDDVISMEVENEIVPNEEQKFEMTEGLYFGFNETRDYVLTVSTGNTKYSVEGVVTSYQRKVVCEEITGSWCQWCIRGHVALDDLRKNNKDTSIGIAVHGSDVMESDYLSALATIQTWSGYPSGIVSRVWSGFDPLNFSQYVGATVDQESVAVAIKPEINVDFDTYAISTTTKLNFADSYEAADFRLLYVIIENNVHHPGDSRYSQQNGYGNGTQGEMGGWENFGYVISSNDMWYHEVARYFDQDINGIKGLLPENITGGETLEIKHDFTIPSGNIDNLHNCELIVMLIAGEDGRIINGEKIALDENAEEPVDVVGKYLGVENITVEVPKVVGIYNLGGVRLEAPTQGVNIIKYSDGSARKIVVK